MVETGLGDEEEEENVKKNVKKKVGEKPIAATRVYRFQARCVFTTRRRSDGVNSAARLDCALAGV